MIDLANLTIKEASKKLRSGELNSVDLTKAYLAEIEKKNQNIFAYLEIFDDAIAQAEQADKMIKAGKGGPLTGIPFAMKDNILIKGKVASAGSKILENYIATYDSHVYEVLRAEGAVVLGRANMDEFAMGSSTETSAFGNTKNPVNTDYVPGGSSGGPASAVAGDMALYSLGSDTGGSIRQPAAYCGLVGLKPTYGAVSRYGLMALASSLDCIGPFTKTVEDAEIVFDIISKHDDRDATNIPDEKRKEVAKANNKKVIGIPRDFLAMEGIDGEVLENFNQAIEKMKEAGYTVRDISLPTFAHSLAVYYIIQPAEASSNLARYDGMRYGMQKKGGDLLDTYITTRREGFGREVKRRIMLGTYVLSSGYYDAYYYKAEKVRNLIKEEAQKAFAEVDVIATPTTPSVAFKFGEKQDPLAMYMADIFTTPANLAGLPAISIPSGKNDAGLPFGIQFIAPHFSEEKLFEIGKDFEQAVVV